MLAVGIASGLGAFTWYYIVRGYPDILKNIVAATMSVHSLFAMLAFIMVPLIFAYALKSRFSYRGLLVLLESRRENA